MNKRAPTLRGEVLGANTAGRPVARVDTQCTTNPSEVQLRVREPAPAFERAPGVGQGKPGALKTGPPSAVIVTKEWLGIG